MSSFEKEAAQLMGDWRILDLKFLRAEAKEVCEPSRMVSKLEQVLNSVKEGAMEDLEWGENVAAFDAVDWIKSFEG